MAAPDAVAFTVVFDDVSENPTTAELRAALEKGTDEAKIDTLKKIVVGTLNGNAQPTLLMPIIQFVLPSKNKALKKLLHFYWEICPKHDENGKLRQEMILVCNAIRNDLQHPNEYIRGATLRFLCKLHDAELLEPLVPSVRSCLEHRHSYVRKHAILAVNSIFAAHSELIPDAPDLVAAFLAAESDATCRRNGFVVLATCARPKAADWLAGVHEQVTAMDELIQLAVLEFIRADPAAPAPRNVRTVFELLAAASRAVQFDAATTLTSLTQNTAAVEQAAKALVALLSAESDGAVRLRVLERLEALVIKYEGAVAPLVVDILRVLTAPDMDVRRAALKLALGLVSSVNAEEVVGFLSKQLTRTVEQDIDKNVEYRQLLIQSIHALAIQHSNVAPGVIISLLSLLAAPSVSAETTPATVAAATANADVISFVRAVVERFPPLRAQITARLRAVLPEIRSGKVARGALWIIGEYADTLAEIDDAFVQVRAALGELPLLAAEQRTLDAAADPDNVSTAGGGGGGGRPRVLADGTYAPESAYTAHALPTTARSKPPLRVLLLGGDFYTATVLASTLAKLVLRHAALGGTGSAHNALRAEAMLVMTSAVRLGQSTFASVPIDEDSTERIMQCVQTLAAAPGEQQPLADVWLRDTRAAFSRMVQADERKEKEARERETRAHAVQVDDVLSFSLFAKPGAVDVSQEAREDMSRATGAGDVPTDTRGKLSRVVQLTGFSDPVYAEAYVKVAGFDILLDVLIVNQTAGTLQNLCIEFQTLGDLKLVERLGTHTLAPHGFHSVKATIKVASTETGVIFGNIIWESGTAESCVILNDIHIDIMDYIKPATCSETQFRGMWTEFEWENRVNVVTVIRDLRTYLAHIMKCTNMACLTPPAALSGDCDFLSANLYARSLFGEDALANLSIESADGVLTGYVRIRSKTQGIALSLGDKITLAQKEVPAPL